MAWVSSTSSLTGSVAELAEATKATDQAAIIADKPTSIVVIRGTTPLTAQTVRIEEQHANRQAQTPAGEVFIVDSIVFGYKGHPTITNTDIRPGDRFEVAGVSYRVIMLAPNTVGSVQAYARVAG